jgi:hypothetical protein
MKKDFKTIKLENLVFSNEKNINGKWKSIDIKYNNKKLEFMTPLIYFPFGIENEYGNYYMKLQFSGVKNNTNPELIYFYQFIQNIENTIINYLKIDLNKFKSSICIKDKYDNLLKTKIISYKKRLNYIINSDTYTTIYEIPKKSWIKCLLYIDKIVYNNDIYTCKILMKEICV